MSRIAKILNSYTNEKGEPEIEFIDDLDEPKKYTLAYRLEWITNYFDGHPGHLPLSEVEQSELEGYLKRMGEKINEFFACYVNADFMNWRSVVEFEHVN